MAAITLKFPLAGKLKVDTGLLYLLVASLNVFVLALIYSGGLEKYLISALILVVVNAFFNGLFVKALFDASYNRARNLLLLSIALFIFACTFPPAITYYISNLTDISANLWFLLAINIYLNALSPLWTPKRYLRVVLICVAMLAVLLLTSVSVLNLLTVADIALVTYLAVTEFRRKYKESFKITRFYVITLLIAGLINFVMHFVIIFTALYMSHLGFAINEVMLSMLPIFVPLAIVFRFHCDVEDLTSNVLRGTLTEIKEIYTRIHSIYTKQTVMCLCLVVAITAMLVLAHHFGLLTGGVVIFSVYYSFVGLLVLSLKYLEIYCKNTAVYIWQLYLALYGVTLVLLDPLKFTITNVAFSLIITAFSLSRDDAEKGIRNLCKYNLKYAWGGG